MAMTNYPYPTSFLEPMPGWPCTVGCTNAKPYFGSDALQVLYQVVSVYFNASGQVECHNLTQGSTPDLGEDGWDYQACTEILMPISSNGKSDFFLPAKWDFGTRAQYCQHKYGVRSRLDWATLQFGGERIADASKIIFSNGRLDPWRGGGIQTSLSDELVAIVIEGACGVPSAPAAGCPADGLHSGRRCASPGLEGAQRAGSAVGDRCTSPRDQAHPQVARPRVSAHKVASTTQRCVRCSVVAVLHGRVRQYTCPLCSPLQCSPRPAQATAPALRQPPNKQPPPRQQLVPRVCAGVRTNLGVTQHTNTRSQTSLPRASRGVSL